MLKMDKIVHPNGTHPTILDEKATATLILHVKTTAAATASTDSSPHTITKAKSGYKHKRRSSCIRSDRRSKAAARRTQRKRCVTRPEDPGGPWGGDSAASADAADADADAADAGPFAPPARGV